MTDDPTTTVTHFADAAEWTGVRDDDRSAWLAVRRTMLTASDLAAILGADPRRDAFSVYVEKVVERTDDDAIGIDDPRFWGKVLEQTILTEVARWYRWGYRRGGALLRNRTHAWLGCTLDAEVTRDGVAIDLEGKTTQMTRDWDEAEQKLPTRVVVQVEGQLATIEQSRALVFALRVGAKPCLIELESVPELRALIYQAGVEFMACLAALDPPPVTAKSADALALLYPKDSGARITLPEEARDWTDRLQQINVALKDLGSEKDLLRNRIREAIGDASIGELPDVAGEGVKLWKNVLEHRAGCFIERRPSSSRVLRALKREPKAKRSTPTVTLRPATRPHLLAETLQQSLAAPAEPILFGRRRRGTR